MADTSAARRSCRLCGSSLTPGVGEQSADPVPEDDEDVAQFHLEPLAVGVLQAVANGYRVAVTFLGVPMVQEFTGGPVLEGKVATAHGDAIPLVRGVVQARIERRIELSIEFCTSTMPVWRFMISVTVGKHVCDLFSSKDGEHGN